MSVEIIRVTDDTSGDDLKLACANVCARAKRIPHVVGTPECPTEWDRRHSQLDELITLILLDAHSLDSPAA